MPLLRKPRTYSLSDKMKTILYSDIIRKKVEVPSKRSKAKLVEIAASRGKKNWYANEVMIESGLIDKKGAYYLVSTIKYLDKDGPLMLKPKKPGKLSPQKTDSFLLSGLIKKMVVDKSGEEIGRVYDFEIHIGRDPWIVWKMLVNPTGLKPKKRRLRIATHDVSEITSTKIKLKREL